LGLIPADLGGWSIASSTRSTAAAGLDSAAGLRQSRVLMLHGQKWCFFNNPRALAALFSTCVLLVNSECSAQADRLEFVG
jgi:hypothetical protein